ncbi:MAG: hypothetical protein J6Y28_01955 [Acholeplasmatales bacterium]|nr:hypothetical protein [Acholeplasmatales bacterium]
MSNFSDMVAYLQHSNANSLYTTSGKYDFTKDARLLNFLTNNLWYTYNKESEQYPYSNPASIPTYLINKRLDNLFELLLCVILRIAPSNFYCKDKKIDVCSALNKINSTTFDTSSTFCIFYDKSNTGIYNSFIMKFLQSLRNSLAHGGFNKLSINNRYNEVYFNNDDINDTKKVSMSLRLIGNANDNFLEKAYNEITSLGSATVFSLFRKIANYYSRRTNNGNNLNLNRYNDKVEVYEYNKENGHKIIYVIDSDDFNEIREIISYIIISLKKPKLDGVNDYADINNSIFYLPVYFRSVAKDKMLEYYIGAVKKEYGLDNNDKTNDEIIKGNIDIKILYKLELMDLL